MRLPFICTTWSLLRRTVECALREADRYGYRLHYAMKANNDRRIMEFIASCGMGADCVSGNEVRRAIETGFAPKDIVYAGVGKKDSEIIYALRQGIFAFNCESKNELVVIDALARELGVVADVALRINPDIDPHTHSYITTGLSENKFGISPREITDVVGMLGDLRNIDIMGLHFHIGSQITDLGVFAEALSEGQCFLPVVYRGGVPHHRRECGRRTRCGLRCSRDASRSGFCGLFRRFRAGPRPARVGRGTLRGSDARSWHNAANSSPRYSLRR